MPKNDYKNYQKDYDRSDVEVVYRRGDWHSWDGAIDWLREEGEEDNELTPGEVDHMIADFEELLRHEVPFTEDPRKAYREAKGHCGHVSIP